MFLSLTESASVLAEQYTHSKSKLKEISKAIRGKKLTAVEKQGLAIELEKEMRSFKELCDLVTTHSEEVAVSIKAYE